MCGGCGGTPSQASTTSTPPPWAEQGIASVAGGAGGIAGLYQSGAYGAYPTQGTAPMNQSQLDALGMMMSAPGVAGPFNTQAMQDYYSGANLIGGGSQLIAGGAGLISEGGPFLGTGANIIGEALPTFGQAAQYAAQGTTPLAGEINQFMNPYTQKAVNATEAQFNNQNAIQSNQLLGSAIQAGNAFGGDREGVAQAQLAGQQQMAEAPVIAGMYNNEFNQAVQDAALQNQQNLQAAGISTGIGAAQVGAGAQMGNIGLGLGALGTQMGGLGAQEGGLGAQMAGIGTQTGQLGLSNAQLELGAGAAAFPAATVGQQTSQAALNAQYAQLMQQFGLPAGIESWLAGIQLPAYGETGGVSTTTGQQGNLWSDFMGLLTAGAGAFGKTAATGKDGGRVGFQGGGVPLGGVPGAPIGSPQYSAFLSPGIFVPPNIQKHGVGIPTSHLPTRQAQQHPSQNTGAGLLGLANLTKKVSLPQANVGVSGSPDDVSVNSGVGVADIADDAAADAGDWRGGVVGYQDGGDTGDYADYMAAVAGPLGQEAAANARLEAMLPAKSGGAIGYEEGGETPDDVDTNPVASSGIAPDLPPPQEEVAPAQKVASADDPRGMLPYVRESAKRYGIDPKTAEKVARSEGLAQFYGDNNTSFGAMQLHIHGGVGDKFREDTGLDPRDPANEKATIDYAMRHAAQHGWGPWHGAQRIGLSQWAGINPDASQGIDAATPLSFAPEGSVAPPIRTAQAAPTSGGRTDTGGLLGFIDSLRPTMSKETKMALMAAGFGMMGPHRDFFRNLGAGAQQGIGTYMTAEKLSQEAQATQARMQREREQSDIGYKTLGLHQQQLNALQDYRLDQLSKPIKMTDENGLEFLVGRDRAGVLRRLDTGKPYLQSPTDKPASSTEPTQNTRTASADGIITANTKLAAQPFDYSKTAPLIEHGMDVPEPMPIGGRASNAIKTDAEYYLQTGRLPPVGGNRGPLAAQRNNYQHAVQNYGVSLAAAHGLSPQQTADMWRTAPGMLRFVLGPDGRSTVALGTAVRHLDTLDQLAQLWNAKPGTSEFQTLNRLKAAVQREFGDEAITNLESAGRIVGPEIIKALGVAGGGGEREREAAGSIASGRLSPQQMTGAVRTTQSLLGGQLEGRKRQAMNAGVSEERFKSLVGDRPYEILSHAGVQPAAAAPTTAPAATPSRVRQNGHTFERQPDGSYKAVD